MGSPERINALAVIPYHEKTFVSGRQLVENRRLKGIRVLVFVDQKKPETFLEKLEHIRSGFQNVQPAGQKIVKIREPVFSFHFLVFGPDPGHCLDHGNQSRKPVIDDILQRNHTVSGQTDGVQDLSGGRKFFSEPFGKRGKNRLEKIDLILPVNDNRRSRIADAGSELPQEAISDMVECPGPQKDLRPGQKIRQTMLEHTGSLLRERQNKHPVGGHSFLQKPGHPMRQHTRLAGTGSG